MSMCFLFTISRPPRYILFPYTTLFRSGFAITLFGDGHALVQRLDVGLVAARQGMSIEGQRDKNGQRERNEHSSRTQRHRDRKSTRLNSSHLVISYAVFCLKKKKR